MRTNLKLAIATVGLIVTTGCHTPVGTLKGEQVVVPAPVKTKVPVLLPPQTTLRTVFHGTQEFSLEEIAGKVVETVDAGGYTYAAVEKDDQRIWVATSPSKVAVGDQVVFQAGEVKRNYQSKKLNRTFPLLVFSRGLINK